MLPAVKVTVKVVNVDVDAVAVLITVIMLLKVMGAAGNLALQYDWAAALVEHLATSE